MNTYHDQLDAFEARVRAEHEETELNKTKYCPLCDGTGYKRISPTSLDTCDHGQPEGSDTSMSAQLNDSGFGSQGVF